MTWERIGNKVAYVVALTRSRLWRVAESGSVSVGVETRTEIDRNKPIGVGCSFGEERRRRCL